MNACNCSYWTFTAATRMCSVLDSSAPCDIFPSAAESANAPPPFISGAKVCRSGWAKVGLIEISSLLVSAESNLTSPLVRKSPKAHKKMLCKKFETGTARRHLAEKLGRLPLFPMWRTNLATLTSNFRKLTKGTQTVLTLVINFYHCTK